jgi:arylsulfatase A-like enzyme
LHEALFWGDHTDQGAVRVGDWKLVSRGGALELYDLESDIGETNNLADANPQIFERLKKTYADWRSGLPPQIERVRT